MLKVILVRSFVAALFFSFSVVAQSASYNADKGRDHGAWSSLKLSLGNYRFYRAINTSDYSDLRVLLDFDAEKCEPELQVHMDSSTSFAKSETIALTDLSIRVDRKPIHEALYEATSVSGERTVYGYVLAGSLPRLISEMRLGRMLRLKFAPFRDDLEPVYAELSLNGSRAALDRAAAMCKQEQVGPESYFDESSEANGGRAEDYF
ncbi:hypothetical protein DXI23_04685 [Marinobacter flavimaris]|uniref:Uncharacterized protein n=1 Tax=Marinobacter flavimaris TaxID=262076 RepID=A0A3D8H8B8_9GAMM|nr:hypothetical protein [Marinobacter flavimaris]PPI78389.1 hypothetical protein MDHKLMBL_20290 [Marinobacter flavimaris]RDU42958.1 hypothetical protein DXI23_04685 [Marinobacter flavimaris]